MAGDCQAVGCCPFHEDRHPSLSVRVTDGVWHCFGCGRSGNALTFCLTLKIDLRECPKGSRLQEHNALSVEHGAYFIWKRQKDGWIKRRISNFVLEWDEENRVSDKIRLEDRVFKGNLRLASGEAIPVRFSNDALCSNASFYSQLILEAGTKISLSEHDAGNIRRASFLFSKARQLRSSMDFGFQDDTRFCTPTLVITAEGIGPAKSTVVDLSSIEHARHLELKKLSDAEVRGLLRHIRDDLLTLHASPITQTVLGFLGAAPMMHFMEDTTRYAMWLIGQSGTGKSFFARLMQCFFGDFAAEGRPVSWASTPNSLQFMGYFFNNCLYLVDDYKPAMIRSSYEVVRFLQNYADFYARSRLTSEIQSQKDYFVRGSLLSTGEDLPAGHASLIARSLILNVPKRPLDTSRGSRCLARCKDYPAVTARYIQYLLSLPDLRNRVNALVREYHEQFLEGIAREDNSVRVARNLALNNVGFFFFTEFLDVLKARFDVEDMREEHFANLIRLRGRMFELISGENPGEIFLRVLSEAIGSGRARIVTAHYDLAKTGPPVVGFQRKKEKTIICVFPREAMGLVRDQEKRVGREFSWTPNAVTKQLFDLDALAKQQNRKDYGTTVRFGPVEHRVWLIRSQVLGLAEAREDEEEDVT
jgi:hypothetical protein